MPGTEYANIVGIALSKQSEILDGRAVTGAAASLETGYTASTIGHRLTMIARVSTHRRTSGIVSGGWWTKMLEMLDLVVHRESP